MSHFFISSLYVLDQLFGDENTSTSKKIATLARRKKFDVLYCAS